MSFISSFGDPFIVWLSTGTGLIILSLFLTTLVVNRTSETDFEDSGKTTPSKSDEGDSYPSERCGDE